MARFKLVFFSFLVTHAVSAGVAGAVPLVPGDIWALSAEGTSVTGIVHVDAVTGARTTVSAGRFSDLSVTTDRVYALAGDAVVEVDPDTGAQTTVASGGNLVAPRGIAIGSRGEIFVLAATSIVRVDPDTGVQSLLTRGGFLDGGLDLESDPHGNVLVLDTVDPFGGEIIRVDTQTGNQTVVAAGSRPARTLQEVSGLGVSPDGRNLYAASFGLDTIGAVTGVDSGSGDALLHITETLGFPDGSIGSLFFNEDVAVDHQGRLLVAGFYRSDPPGVPTPIPPGSAILRFDLSGGPSLGAPERVTEGLFRELQIVPIPEPTGALAFLVGLTVIGSWSLRRRI